MLAGPRSRPAPPTSPRTTLRSAVLHHGTSASAAVISGPLTALAYGTVGGNGVYRYGGAGSRRTPSTHQLLRRRRLRHDRRRHQPAGGDQPRPASGATSVAPRARPGDVQRAGRRRHHPIVRTGSVRRASPASYDAGPDPTFTPTASLATPPRTPFACPARRTPRATRWRPCRGRSPPRRSRHRPPTEGPGGPIAVVTSGSDRSPATSPRSSGRGAERVRDARRRPSSTRRRSRLTTPSCSD